MTITVFKKGTFESNGKTRNWMIITAEKAGFEISGICNPIDASTYEVGKEYNIPESVIDFSKA